jgi:hypothetical protein
MKPKNIFMKHLYFLIISTLLFSECTNNNTDIKSPAKDSIKSPISKTVKPVSVPRIKTSTIDTFANRVLNALDTIVLSNHILYIEQIDRRYYDSIALTNITEKYENYNDVNIKDYTDSTIFRLGKDTLVYKLKSCKYDTLINNPDGMMDYSCYKSWGYIKDINSFVIGNFGYEGYGLELINDEHNTKTDADDNFVISPDRTRLLTYKYDGWGYESGGFKLYDISDGELKREMYYSPYEISFEKQGFGWALSDVYMIDKRTFIFKNSIIKYKFNIFRELYCRLSIKDKKLTESVKKDSLTTSHNL